MILAPNLVEENNGCKNYLNNPLDDGGRNLGLNCLPILKEK
jgi:hypothetical protein